MKLWEEIQEATKCDFKGTEQANKFDLKSREREIHSKLGPGPKQGSGDYLNRTTSMLHMSNNFDVVNSGFMIIHKSKIYLFLTSEIQTLFK